MHSPPHPGFAPRGDIQHVRTERNAHLRICIKTDSKRFQQHIMHSLHALSYPSACLCELTQTLARVYSVFRERITQHTANSRHGVGMQHTTYTNQRAPCTIQDTAYIILHT